MLLVRWLLNLMVLCHLDGTLVVLMNTNVVRSEIPYTLAPAEGNMTHSLPAPVILTPIQPSPSRLLSASAKNRR